MTTTHAIASASPGGVSHPASLGETVEWFDAKGRSETGLPDYLDIDFRVWQDGRSGIYLTANQREVLAPTGVLFWTLKNGRLVFAARYRPAQSIASQTHGVVRLNDRNLASIQRGPSGPGRPQSLPAPVRHSLSIPIPPLSIPLPALLIGYASW